MNLNVWAYFIFVHLSLFLILSNSTAVAQSTGTIVKFTISGTNHTNFTGKSFRKDGYEDEVEQITFNHLKEKYELNQVDISQEPKIKTKFFNGPFGSVTSQTKKQKLQAFDKEAAMSFKIKCKVKSREGLLGILLPNVSSNNAFLLVKIGVFDNGKFKEKLKARKKIVSGFSISSDDEEGSGMNLMEKEFISVYSNALTQLEVY